MKFDRIVMAIDFSEHSIAAAQWVARQFAPRAELVLVHVLELPPQPSFWRRRVWLRADDIETYRIGAKTRLRLLGQQIGRGPVWEEVRHGRPADEVLRVAAEYDADLIVVGSHRERDGFWNRFGSAAERILGGADVPVLIVHGAPRAAPRLLLAAVDDSATGDRVIAHTRAITRSLRANGRIVHVLPSAPFHLPLFPGELISHDGAYREARDELIQETREWLRERATEESSELTPLVLQGHAPEAILREARLAGADLLVIGREREGTMRRHLLGSVAGTVIRGAQCPVLVIPSTRRHAAPALEQASAASNRELDSALGGVGR